MEIVKLEIEKKDYDYLKDILAEHKKGLYKLGVAPLYKENLIKDINMISSILKKSERGE